MDHAEHASHLQMKVRGEDECRDGAGARVDGGRGICTSANGSILRHVAQHLRGDEEVVLEAMKRDKDEFLHASEDS